jgi:hypothetical protein
MTEQCHHFATRQTGIRSEKVTVCLRNERRRPQVIDPLDCSICRYNTVPESLRNGAPPLTAHPCYVHPAPPRTERREMSLSEIWRIGVDERNAPTVHQ